MSLEELQKALDGLKNIEWTDSIEVGDDSIHTVCRARGWLGLPVEVRNEIERITELFSVFAEQNVAKEQALRKLLAEIPICANCSSLGWAGDECTGCDEDVQIDELCPAMQKWVEKVEKVFGEASSQISCKEHSVRNLWQGMNLMKDCEDIYEELESSDVPDYIQIMMSNVWNGIKKLDEAFKEASESRFLSVAEARRKLKEAQK